MKLLKFYIWTSITPQGKRLFGEIQAYHIDHAKLKLKQQGINPVYIKRKYNSYLKQLHTITQFDILIFFRQLATLVSSGIPLIKCFEILQQTQEKIQFRLLLQTLKNEIMSGKNLASGLLAFPRYFDDLSYQLIKAGELTGTLETMLNRVADYKEKSFTLKKQLLNTLLYPGVILGVAIIISIAMSVFIVPKFAEMFQQFHGQLPIFTRCVISLSTIMGKYLWMGFFFFIISSGLILFFRKYKTFILYRDYLMLKIPIVGKAIKNIILARFARSLATAFSAGVPIMDALQISANTCGNQNYINAIISLRTDVLNGIQLHQTMQTNHLFPLLVVQLIKIGEESGTLESMLNKIADLYEADVESLIKNLNQLLEPLIMIILGVLIGGLIIAMYLPIFKLGTVT